MNKIILLLIVVVVFAGCLWSVTQIEQKSDAKIQNDTQMQNDTTASEIVNNEIRTDGTGTNDTSSSNDVNIVTFTEAPKKAKNGQDITVKYVITNKGAQTVYSLKIEGESNLKNMGTLKPGETKTYSYIEHIYGPVLVGGDVLFFKDSKCKKHKIRFDRVDVEVI